MGAVMPLVSNRCKINEEEAPPVFNMAASRLPPAALSLKQFLQRQKVLAVYRDLHRTIRKIPQETDRKYLRDWAREEFKRNKSEADQDVIRMMVTQAHNHLEDLRRSLALAGC